jgi:hypothetical protein
MTGERNGNQRAHAQDIRSGEVAGGEAPAAVAIRTAVYADVAAERQAMTTANSDAQIADLFPEPDAETLEWAERVRQR